MTLSAEATGRPWVTPERSLKRAVVLRSTIAAIRFPLSASTKQKRHPYGTAFDAQDRGRTIHQLSQESINLTTGAAKSAAFDSDLAEVAARWPNLPSGIRTAILAIVRQHRSH